MALRALMLNGRAIMRNGRALGRLAASACCCGATGPCVPAIPCEPCVNQTGPTCFVNVGPVRMWSFSGSPIATVNYATTNCCRCGPRANRNYTVSIEETSRNFLPNVTDCNQLRTINGTGVPNAQNRIVLQCSNAVTTPLPSILCQPSSFSESTQASIVTACRPGVNILAGPSGLPWGQAVFITALLSVGNPVFSNVVNQFAQANPATFQAFGYMREDCDSTEWNLQTIDTSAPDGTVTTVTSRGFIGLNRNPGSCHPVTCQPEGACCCGGSCYAQVTQSQCAGMGGTWRGPNTYCDTVLACTQPGACCINQQCQQLSQGDCIAQGGVWRGVRPCIQRECVGITTPNPGGPLTPIISGIGSIGAGAFL
jgi:hypothetical protein